MKTTDAELQQLRIAVATAEGWRIEVDPKGIKNDGKRSGGIYDGSGEPHGFLWISPGDTLADHSYNLPDFSEDRNAIIGAIVRRFVTGDDRTKFERALMNILGRHWLPFDVATATAEQLCRAYVAAAGIPTEGQPK